MRAVFWFNIPSIHQSVAWRSFSLLWPNELVLVFSQSELINKMNQFYAVIIPSFCDGWNVVANEAIHAGLAVIASDKCGSRDLVTEGNIGYVFEAGNIQALSCCLEKLILFPKVLENMKHCSCQYSKNISGQGGAQYLIKVFNFVLGTEKVKSMPPWYRVSA